MSGIRSPGIASEPVPRLVRLVSQGCYMGAVAAGAVAVGVTASWEGSSSVGSVLVDVLTVLVMVVSAVGAVVAGLSVVETGRLAGVWAVVAGSGASAVLLPAVLGDRLGLDGRLASTGGAVAYGLALVWAARHQDVRVWLALRREHREQQVQDRPDADLSYTEWT
ncbi:hypothetical protein QTQ03_28315 [Micromonospora sp. WMMA1363]|uniref:hypothetical protein n=1 Tax=Micromonospora sp. WMMA1363 TaxID=3053985 RepID=UPI00259C9F18|nr:hypothetical protein [Micromonospora sp. WMMA1363]MDM4723312.1 hypothetical protein [Micromonospora sp. WMMA1363]